jgi:catechol 2,3-dioxygenase-like lactoylglutathione lyase family enzyme
MSKQFLHGIDTVILRVSNLEASKTWYTKRLGLKSIYEDLNHKLVVLDAFGPVSLTIWETSERIDINPLSASFPIFKTFDAAEAHTELKKLDVVVGDLTKDNGVIFFTFFDLDNNVLEVCQVHD